MGAIVFHKHPALASFSSRSSCFFSRPHSVIVVERHYCTSQYIASVA